VILSNWDTRFSQIEVTAIMDLNRAIIYSNLFSFHHDLKPLVDERLLSPIVIDLRVVLIWDTDMTDVELHITEPTQEECYCFHNKTSLGGMLSRDFTKGYGPEEYLLRNAAPGEYKIMIKLFNSFSRYTGTTAQIRIWTHFNNPFQEREYTYTCHLQNNKDSQMVAIVTFYNNPITTV